MASADFTINGSTCPPELAVSASSTVTLALISTSGARTIAWSIVGNHAEGVTNPTITPAGTPSGATATFAIPSGAGQAYLVQCVINGGVDETGQEVTNYTKTAIVGVLSATTGLVPFVNGEVFERSATHGYTEALNGLGGSGGGGVTDHGALTGLADDDHPHYELAQRPQTTAYTAASNDAALLDARKCIITTRATAISLRIRLQASIVWLADTLLGGINTGAGTLTITAEGGVTLNGSVTVPQNGWWWAKRTAANTWQVFTGGTSGGAGDFMADGSVPATGDFDLDSHKITALTDGSTGTQEAASVAQVEALIAASTSNVADWKQSVRAATSAALPANTRVSNVLTANANGALAAQDGVTLIVGDRLLVKDEVTGANRGIYTVTAVGSGGAPWSLTRATDADANAEVTCGLTVLVEEGTVAAGKPYILTTANPITVNTTALTFTQLSSATAGNGLTGTGSLSVLAENATIVVGAGGVKRAAISGDVTIADGSNTAAITAGVIVDGDVNAAAAIAGTKVAPNFGAQAIVTTGTLGAAKTTLAPTVETSGSPYAFKVTGAAHTTLAASTQAPDIDWALARTVQFATGALTAQRAIRITAPTYGFVGASVISDAATLAISGPPVAGTNATLTRTFPLWVESGVARFDGGIRVGSSPVATTGLVRIAHNQSAFVGLNNAGSADRYGVRWGVSATDVWTFGDATTATELLGLSVRVGDTNTHIEVASLSGSTVLSLLLGADVSATQMPANTGSKVAFIAAASTEPSTGSPVGGDILWVSNVAERESLRTKNPNGGSWAISPTSNWHHYFYSATDTTTTTGSEVIATFNLAALGNGSGEATLTVMSRDATNAQGCKVYGFSFTIQAGALISGSTTPTALYGSNALLSALALAYPGSPNINVELTAADANTNTHHVLLEIKFHPNAA